MSIITISRGSYSRGKEVAEEVARRLGYECISRDLILEASEQYNVPQIKLVRAIHDAPGILESFGSDKRKYIAFIRAALLRRLQGDNKVYHGLAGHFFLQGVSHVLKVRIISDMDDRVKLEMERENISAKEALKVLKRDDQERRKWSRSLYGIDTWDPGLYDLVIHIKRVAVDDAADIICHAAGLERFRTTETSQRILDDMVIEAEVQVKLMNWYPDVKVRAKYSNVEVEVKGTADRENEIKGRVTELASRIKDVRQVKVNIIDVER